MRPLTAVPRTAVLTILGMMARRSEARALSDGRRTDPGPKGQRAEPGHLHVGFDRIVAPEKEAQTMIVNSWCEVDERHYSATMPPSPSGHLAQGRVGRARGQRRCADAEPGREFQRLPRLAPTELGAPLSLIT
jgi:hypothetical protein